MEEKLASFYHIGARKDRDEQDLINGILSILSHAAAAIMIS
jgi:hypothetical protein